MTFVPEVKLPDQKELLRRLISVHNNEYLKEHFYPKILVHAGKSLNGWGILSLVEAAAGEYIHERDIGGRGRQALYLQIPEFLKAIIGETHKDVLNDALEALKQSTALL